MILSLLFLIIACEALTELVLEAKPLEGFRRFVTRSIISRVQFLDGVLECGYCLSVWSSILLVGLYILIPTVSYWINLGLVTHRLSNVLHEIFSRLFARLPRHSLVETISVTED